MKKLQILMCLIMASCSHEDSEKILITTIPTVNIKYQNSNNHCLYIEEYGYYASTDSSEPKYFLNGTKTIEYTSPCKSVEESDFKNNINKQTMEKINDNVQRVEQSSVSYSSSHNSNTSLFYGSINNRNDVNSNIRLY